MVGVTNWMGKVGSRETALSKQGAQSEVAVIVQVRDEKDQNSSPSNRESEK